MRRGFNPCYISSQRIREREKRKEKMLHRSRGRSKNVTRGLSWEKEEGMLKRERERERGKNEQSWKREIWNPPPSSFWLGAKQNPPSILTLSLFLPFSPSCILYQPQDLPLSSCYFVFSCSALFLPSFLSTSLFLSLSLNFFLRERERKIPRKIERKKVSLQNLDSCSFKLSLPSCGSSFHPKSLSLSFSSSSETTQIFLSLPLFLHSFSLTLSIHRASIQRAASNLFVWTNRKRRRKEGSIFFLSFSFIIIPLSTFPLIFLHPSLPSSLPFILFHLLLLPSDKRQVLVYLFPSLSLFSPSSSKPYFQHSLFLSFLSLSSLFLSLSLSFLPLRLREEKMTQIPGCEGSH